MPPTPNPFIFGNPPFQVFAVYTPKNAASALVDLEIPAGLADSKFRFHLDANYAGRQYSFQARAGEDRFSFIVNGRVALADIEMNQGSTLLTFSLWSPKPVQRDAYLSPLGGQFVAGRQRSPTAFPTVVQLQRHSR